MARLRERRLSQREIVASQQRSWTRTCIAHLLIKMTGSAIIIKITSYPYNAFWAIPAGRQVLNNFLTLGLRGTTRDRSTQQEDLHCDV